MLNRPILPEIKPECEAELVPGIESRLDDLGFAELASLAEFADERGIHVLRGAINSSFVRRFSKLIKFTRNSKGVVISSELCDDVDRNLDFVSFSDLEWLADQGKHFYEYGSLSAAAERAKIRRLKEYVVLKRGIPECTSFKI